MGDISAYQHTGVQYTSVTDATHCKGRGGGTTSPVALGRTQYASFLDLSPTDRQAINAQILANLRQPAPHLPYFTATDINRLDAGIQVPCRRCGRAVEEHLNY